MQFQDFKKKSFLIPLNIQGEWSDYKNFNSQQWRQNILNVLLLIITENNPKMKKKQLSEMAEKHLDMILNNVKSNLSPERPCLVLGFPPAQCWFVSFIVDAFLPLEQQEQYILGTNYYANHEQNIEIIKAKGDPLQFAFNLVSTLK